MADEPTPAVPALVATRRRASRPRILVVDDEPDACEVVRQLLEGEDFVAISETSAHRALERLASQDFDLVLTDVAMVEMNGLELCRKLVGARPDVPFIVMTGEASMNTAISAFRLGARDFLTKPLDARALVGSVIRSVRHHARRGDASAAAGEGDFPAAERTSHGLLGKSAPMQEVHDLVGNLSGVLVSVVIQGETGTGKELVARALHANSRVREAPFVALNCAAMPAGLLESELFGHVRGAFTDAKTAEKGLFLAADGGTLLLDEIGELPLEVQPKLLRALQERKIRPIGGRKEIPFDCRIIAATNRDLEVEVREKRFREDLYYRLNVVGITVPPLRERGDDILLLARYFSKLFAKDPARPPTLTPSAEATLLAYHWPGNVRELENCIMRAASLARRDELTADDLPERIRTLDVRCEQPPKAGPEPDWVPLIELERRHILRAMKLVGGNRGRAAELLGIDRSTLYRHLQRHGVLGSS